MGQIVKKDTTMPSQETDATRFVPWMDFGDREACDSITDVCSAGTAIGGGTKKFEFGTCCCAGFVAALITDFRLKILLNPPALEVVVVGVLDLLALSWLWGELFTRLAVPPKAKPAAASVLPIIPALAVDVDGFMSELDAIYFIKNKTDGGLQPDIDLFFEG